MKRKKIVLFVFLIVGVLSLILTYKFKQSNLNKNKPIKEEKLSIMIKEDGANDYTKSSSKDIPKGNYTLNTEKSYCKNNGKIEGYDNATGTVSFAFVGTDRCFLYFDYYSGPKGWETILLNNGNGATTIDEAKAYIISKGTPNLTVTATENEGMYATEDDQGTSYYFRGAVDNNWIKFGAISGKSIYWRIIRINGDGSIRMIYTGTTAPTESQKVVMTETSTRISAVKFNSNYDKAEYVGYKYEIGKQHGLANDSTIKTTIDNWYKTTSLFLDFPNYTLNDIVADSPFCYDRSASTSTTGTYGEIDSWASTGTKYYYGSYGRIFGNKTGPSLKCQNELDLFSYNTRNGNGTLTYPVGLITVDEIMFAGGINSANNSYYLYTGLDYWTGSPVVPEVMFAVLQNGAPAPFVFKDNNLGVRPVISLSSKAKLSGDGTWNNPYVVHG